MSKTITLSHSFSVHGNWWLPGSPSDQVSGTLIFEPGDHAQLELAKCFLTLSSQHLFKLSSKSETVEMIVGRSDEGVPWIAGGCLPTRFGLDDSSEVTFLARYCVAGYDPPSDAQPLFSEIHIQTTHLTEWARQLPKQYVKMPSIRIQYSTRQKRLFAAKVAAPVGHISLFSWSYPSYAATEMHVHSETQWIFKSATPIAFQKALAIAQSCRDFLTLMAGRGVDITRLLGLCERKKQTPSTGREPLQTEPVLAEIIVGLAQSDRKSPARFQEPRVQLAELPDPAKAVAQWFSNYSALDEVIGLILAPMYVTGYTTTEFLNLTQALEALHRRTAEGVYYPPKQFEAIRQSLVEAVPHDLPPDPKSNGDFRKKLISSHQYANEYSLRMRLRELLKGLSPTTLMKLGSDPRIFIDRITKTRNYLTHLDEQSRPGTLVADPNDLTDLWKANVKLGALATILLLKRIGIPEEVAAKRAFFL